MRGNKQPEKKMTLDGMFVVAVAVVGCFFGLVLETWWILVVGVSVMAGVYVTRKQPWHFLSKMRPDSIKRGMLIAWIAVALLGLFLVGWAVRFYTRAGGSYLAIPEIVGIIGIWMAIQGIAKVRRLNKKTPPDEEA